MTKNNDFEGLTEAQWIHLSKTYQFYMWRRCAATMRGYEAALRPFYKASGITKGSNETYNELIDALDDFRANWRELASVAEVAA